MITEPSARTKSGPRGRLFILLLFLASPGCGSDEGQPPAKTSDDATETAGSGDARPRPAPAQGTGGASSIDTAGGETPGGSTATPGNSGTSTNNDGGNDLGTLFDNLADILNGGQGSGSGAGTDNGDAPGGSGGQAPEPGDGANPSPGDCYKGDPFTCEVELAIVRLTNQKRGSSSPLTHDAKLAFVARDWSKSQGQRGVIGHSGFPNQRQTVYQAEFGQRASIMAENVAMSSINSNGSAEQVATQFVNMWWNSAGHRRNMLGNYLRLGAGVYKTGNAVYATQIFGN